jgi:hypothetical protein
MPPPRSIVANKKIVSDGIQGLNHHCKPFRFTKNYQWEQYIACTQTKRAPVNNGALGMQENISWLWLGKR